MHIMNANAVLEVPTATTPKASAARRARPYGFDLLVMRISLAMLLWARRRADRTAVTRAEQRLHYLVALERERHDHEAPRGFARLV
jgi:hypothetical protein